jgi:acyl dehydratase
VNRANLFLDEMKVGERFESRGLTLTEADIVAFAREWDPQPFHIDAEAASRSPFGGLIASGFQTLAAGFRVLYQTGFLVDASLGGPGIDDLRWTAPVRPGDTLRTAATVQAIQPSRSKPDRGVLRLGVEVMNQRGGTVMTCTFIILVRRRRE